MTPADADRNLLFGVLALQGELIDAGQFAEACTAWAARKKKALADILIDRGWLSAEDREHIDYLLRRKLAKHAGDAHASLVAAVSAAPASLAPIGRLRDDAVDADLRQTLADLPRPDGHQYLSTLGRPPETRERYTLTRMHAKGGIGQVWLARDGSLDREVALKEVRPEQADNAAVLARFLQEARITGQLDHPGVVPIYEVARGDGARPYYTMRFIRGRTLKDAVADYHRKRAEGHARRTDLLGLLQAFVGVCNTVAFAHSRGVIHRDLKGLNIVLGEFGEVILLDWGLAKLVDRAGADDRDDADRDPAGTVAWPSAAADAGMTAAGQALGTPAYMAPEQAEGRLDRIGRRTDIYGLGAILYEVLAGRPPFDGPTTLEVLRKVREVPPEPPRRLNPDAPRALEAACLKAMAKNPDDRYASAAEVAADVQHWLADEPVSAWREPWTTRARRWVGRHRTLVASGAAALVVAVAALAILLADQARANRDLQAALKRESDARDEAGARYDLASQALDSYTTGVSQDVILRRPELEELRRRLLGTSLGFYERLARDLEGRGRAGGDLHRLRMVGSALERVATLQAVIGARDEAIRTRRKVVDLYDTLPVQGPELAAQQLRELGSLQRLAGRPDDAMRSLREALGRFERLDTGGSQRYQVARTLVDLGLLQKDVGLADEARRSLESARGIYEELRRGNPRSRVVEYLAANETALGNLFTEAGRADEALRSFLEANRLYEELAAVQPKISTYYQAELARSLNNLGLAQVDSGRTDEGRRTLERGRAIREALLADQPLNIDFRADLARSEFHFARLEARAGRPSEALEAVRKAEALYTGIPPKAPEDRYYRACLLALRAGLIAAGKPDAELSDDERAERRRAADGAMERLKEAVGNGFRNVTLMRHDAPLDSIRSRPDFQELLRTLDRPRP